MNTSENESENESNSNSKRLCSRKYDTMEESDKSSNLTVNTSLVVSKEIQKVETDVEEDGEKQIFNKENYNPQINQEEIEENKVKKRRMKYNTSLNLRKEFKKESLKIEKCNICKQKLEDIILYQGHPSDAVEEIVALIDPKLCIFTGDEDYIHENDIRPQNKLTNFSLYDKEGHMCPFDAGLIEANVELLFSGYMKPIYDEDPSPEGGIPTKDMGPLIEWYISGFDGGELVLIGFNTALAEYILMEPSEAYAPIMNGVKTKIYLSKLIIEFLLDETVKYEDPKYEDLINKIQTVVPPKDMIFTEDSLLHSAQFICDQVSSFDTTADADTDEVLLMNTSCMQSLANYGNVTLGKKNPNYLGQRRLHRQKIKKPVWTKATTTKLVNNMFENIFTDQLIKRDDASMALKRQRCGVCENCQQPDCGICSFCKDMLKFGGSGRSKQACARRKCSYMTIQEADDSDPENDDLDDRNNEEIEKSKNEFTEKYSKKKIIWEEENKIVDGENTYFKSVILGNERIQLNDFVFVEPRNPTHPLHIYKIIHMLENKNGLKKFHGNWLRRGTQTILGETSDPIELFQTDGCDDIPFTCVKSKATVIHKKRPENWSELGNVDIDEEINTDNNAYFYTMRYTPETARFEDLLPDPECTWKRNTHRFCPACTRLRTIEHHNIPKVFERIEEKSSKEVIYGVVKYKGEEYKVGDAVFLYPGAFKFKYIHKYQEPPKVKREDVDEDIYPEYYRKAADPAAKFSNFDTPEPFYIGYINMIYANTTDPIVSASNIYIKINKIYRPENTHRDTTLMEQADLNMVYWSDEGKLRRIKKL